MIDQTDPSERSAIRAERMLLLVSEEYAAHRVLAAAIENTAKYRLEIATEELAEHQKVLRRTQQKIIEIRDKLKETQVQLNAVTAEFKAYRAASTLSVTPTSIESDQCYRLYFGQGGTVTAVEVAPDDPEFKSGHLLVTYDRSPADLPTITLPGHLNNDSCATAASYTFAIGDADGLRTENEGRPVSSVQYPT